MPENQGQGRSQARSQDRSRRGAMVGLAVIVVVFVVGWLLAHELYAGGKLEDCLMSGRTNCEPIQQPAR